MSSPLIDPNDLGTYLGNASIDLDRATALIEDAQTLCESILTPLPATAAPIVKRIAARAYSNAAQLSDAQIGTAHLQFGAGATGSPIGGLYLSRADKADLRRLAGGGGAFSVDMVPDYSTVETGLPWWDRNVLVIDDNGLV